MEVIMTLGRRKTAVARIYLKEGDGKITVNDRDYKEYFPTLILQYQVVEPFNITNTFGKYDVRVNLDGGGITGQAEALKSCNFPCSLQDQRRKPAHTKSKRIDETGSAYGRTEKARSKKSKEKIPI